MQYLQLRGNTTFTTATPTIHMALVIFHTRIKQEGHSGLHEAQVAVVRLNLAISVLVFASTGTELLDCL